MVWHHLSASRLPAQIANAVMPLTLAALEAIRDELCADDIAIPGEAVSWVEDEAREFFDSGGQQLPRKPGLDGAEVVAYYEVRKPTVHNVGPGFLTGALNRALFGGDCEQSDADSSAAASVSAAAAAAVELGTLAELQARGGHVAELRALVVGGHHAALTARLKTLGYAKLGHRVQIEHALRKPVDGGDGGAAAAAAPPADAEPHDGEELLRSLRLDALWPKFETDGLTSVRRLAEAMTHDPQGFDKQMALMGIKRVQRRLLVSALRQAAGGGGAAVGSSGGGGGRGGGVGGPAGDGYVTEDDDEFDAEEWAGAGELV